MQQRLIGGEAKGQSMMMMRWWCTNRVIKGGICTQVKRCRIVGCTNHSNCDGLCRRHGAIAITRRITAFGSEYDDTTAKLPKQECFKSFCRRTTPVECLERWLQYPLSRYCSRVVIRHSHTHASVRPWTNNRILTRYYHSPNENISHFAGSISGGCFLLSSHNIVIVLEEGLKIYRRRWSLFSTFLLVTLL